MFKVPSRVPLISKSFGTEITLLAGSNFTVAVGRTGGLSFFTSSNVSPPPQPVMADAMASESSSFFIISLRANLIVIVCSGLKVVILLPSF